MGFFERLRPKTPAAQAISVQTRRTPVLWETGLPAWGAECGMYDALRHKIPLIDAAIDRICRLVGGCHPQCEDPAAQKELEQFFQQVPAGPVCRGMENFLRGYLESLLTYGTAVGEIVLSGDGKEIAGLYQGDLRYISFQEGENPFQTQVLVAKENWGPQPVPFPELLLLCALNPKPGQLKGVSLLESLPFVCDILQKIYASIGENFQRVANLRYAVTYKPGEGALDQAGAKEIASTISREWADAMDAAKYGQIKDFVAVGDVDIKVIGADNRMIDSQVPVRQMLEQIVAKLGVPPFLLGLSWSTTERMSSLHADLLTSEVESYRRLLEPVLLKICRVFLRLGGYGCEPSIRWENINLQDELELAQARLANLQADQLEQTLAAGKEQTQWNSGKA